MDSITLLDGSMGQEIVNRSGQEPHGLWPTLIMRDQPEMVRGVHDDYFAAGAEIATTNTYVLHHDRLQSFDMDDQFEALHHLACRLACESRDAHKTGLVAGSLGPMVRSYRPDLALAADEAAESFAEIARLHAPYVDFMICETMSSVEQARGAVMGAQAADKPVWLSVTVDDTDGTKLRSGEPVQEILSLVQELDVAALLVNCAIPEAVTQAVAILTDTGHGIPVGAYANGFTKITKAFTHDDDFTVASLEKRADLDANVYADHVATWIESGATIIGGCCEVGPTHIAELAKRFKA